MVRIGNYVADITITLQDAEVADLLGIDNDAERLDVAYDTIDWDEIEDELTRIAQALVAKQGTRVRPVVEKRFPEENPADEVLGGMPDDGEGGLGVWCRFSVVPKVTDGRAWYPPLDIDDIRPALDAISIRMLPKWGEDWLHMEYRCGKNIVVAVMNAGLIDADAWQSVEFDGIDEPAYEDYYDERARQEGLLPVER